MTTVCSECFNEIAGKPYAIQKSVPTEITEKHMEVVYKQFIVCKSCKIDHVEGHVKKIREEIKNSVEGHKGKLEYIEKEHQEKIQYSETQIFWLEKIITDIKQNKEVTSFKPKKIS